MATRARKPQKEQRHRPTRFALREHGTYVVEGDCVLEHLTLPVERAEAHPADPLDQSQETKDRLAARAHGIMEASALAVVFRELGRRLPRVLKASHVPLLEQGTKALRDLEWARNALRKHGLHEEEAALVRLGYVAGFDDGYEYALTDPRAIFPNLKERTERETRSDTGRKAVHARIAKGVKGRNQLRLDARLAEVDRYQADMARSPRHDRTGNYRIDACRYVARRTLGADASPEEVEKLAQNLARRHRERRKRRIATKPPLAPAPS